MTSFLINPYRFGVTDPNFASVVLLLHGDGTNGSTTITDSSGSPKTVTAFGNAAISTAQSKFGGASIAFDGTGDYLTATDSTFAFGTGDFTVEAFVYFNNLTGRKYIVSVTDGTSGGFGITSDGTTKIDIVNPGFAVVHSFTTSLATSTWYHIAVSRSGSSLRCFLNGNQIGTTATNTNNYSQTRLVVGIDADLTLNPLSGYEDEIRITKGVARYTANFTPPTAPFPDS
jgi:hypothetical protein